MGTTIEEFNILKNTMQKYCLYQEDDDVALDLECLEDKLIEIEKRLAIVDFIGTDINDTISKYTQRVDDGLLIKLSVTDHDVIRTGSDDLKTISDLADDMPIVDNWYELFNDSLSIEEAVKDFESKRSSRVSINEEVDGETLQAYISKLGMTDQMLRQLVLTLPLVKITDLLEERKELENKKFALVIEGDIATISLRTENVNQNNHNFGSIEDIHTYMPDIAFKLSNLVTEYLIDEMIDELVRQNIVSKNDNGGVYITNRDREVIYCKPFSANSVGVPITYKDADFFYVVTYPYPKTYNDFILFKMFYKRLTNSLA